MRKGRDACSEKQSTQGTAALLLLLFWGTAVPHVRSAVTDPQGFPDTNPAPKLPSTAAAPEQARQCLLKMFKTTEAHMRERKVCSIGNSCCCLVAQQLPTHLCAI
jgi:hypothetical protein